MKKKSKSGFSLLSDKSLYNTKTRAAFADCPYRFYINGFSTVQTVFQPFILIVDYS